MIINDSFSYWSEILFGVSQGSILGSLLVNIFICDMFCLMVNFEIANYPDDSTPFSAKLDDRSVVDELEILSSILFTWLKKNYMKAIQTAVIFFYLAKITLQLIWMETA